jgi:DNA-binding transcriptional ArsR family regulator
VSGAGVCADGRLADELAVTLEPKLQDALNHPTRREVLRVLHAAERPCGVNEILGELLSLTRGEVSYHVQVLQLRGSILADGTRPAPRGREVLYRSALEGDAAARSVLQATERSDYKRRQEAMGERSPSFLTMFRVPRPGLTIRLGDRSRRKTKREG